jgi:hypothetical protein
LPESVQFKGAKGIQPVGQLSGADHHNILQLLAPLGTLFGFSLVGCLCQQIAESFFQS